MTSTTTKHDAFKLAHRIARQTAVLAGSYRLAFADALRFTLAGGTYEEYVGEMLRGTTAKQAAAGRKALQDITTAWKAAHKDGSTMKTEGIRALAAVLEAVSAEAASRLTKAAEELEARREARLAALNARYQELLHSDTSLGRAMRRHEGARKAAAKRQQLREDWERTHHVNNPYV